MKGDTLCRYSLLKERINHRTPLIRMLQLWGQRFVGELSPEALTCKLRGGMEGQLAMQTQRNAVGADCTFCCWVALHFESELK